jgi:hypothetical protein
MCYAIVFIKMPVFQLLVMSYGTIASIIIVSTLMPYRATQHKNLGLDPCCRKLRICGRRVTIENNTAIIFTEFIVLIG